MSVEGIARDGKEDDPEIVVFLEEEGEDGVDKVCRVVCW